MYLGKSKSADWRNMFENLDLLFQEKNQNKIDIKEFSKNQLRNISTNVKFLIIDVDVIHEIDADNLIKLNQSMKELFSSFNKLILIINDADFPADIKGLLQSHSGNGQNYIIISESNEEKLIEKVEEQLVELLGVGEQEVSEQEEESKIVPEEESEIKEAEASEQKENVIFYRGRTRNNADERSVKEIQREWRGVKAQKEEKKNVSVNKNVKADDKNLNKQERKINLVPDPALKDLIEQQTEKEWQMKNKGIVLIGTQSNVGTTFIGFALAQRLNATGAYAVYNMVPRSNDDLSYKVLDYGLKKEKENVYNLNGVMYTRGLVDCNANFTIYDADLSAVKMLLKKIDLAQFIIVSEGNNTGLNALKSCLSKVNALNVEDIDIIIVNPILSMEHYDKFANDKIKVHTWEYASTPTEFLAVEQNCFSEIVERLRFIEQQELSITTQEEESENELQQMSI